MNWNNLLLKLYRMIESKEIETPKMDEFVRSLSDSDNATKIAFYIWRDYYNHQDRKIEFWGGFFREIIDFVKANELKPRKVLIDLAQPIVDKYNDNDIAKVFYYIIKEIEQK